MYVRFGLDLLQQQRPGVQVTVPEKLQTQLKAEMEMAGIPLPSSDQRWEQALTALKVPPPPNPVPSTAATTTSSSTAAITLHELLRRNTLILGPWTGASALFPYKRAYIRSSHDKSASLGRLCAAGNVILTFPGCRGCGRACTTSGPC